MYFAGLINTYNSYQNDINRFKFQVNHFFEQVNKKGNVQDIIITESDNVNDFVLSVRLDFELSFEELLAFESEFHCRLKKELRSKNVFCYCFIRCLKMEDLI